MLNIDYLKERIALLVLSCDKYSDLWPNYFHLLKTFWPDCPFRKYLQTNFLDFDDANDLKILKIGKDKSWSDGLIKSVEKLNKYDYVLLMMEDMFLRKPVNNERLIRVIQNFINIDGNFITLINEPLSDKNYNNNFGVISNGAIYRATATASLWKKEVLLDILDGNESAWQFEKLGSERTDKYGKFYSVHESIFDFFHGVIKGAWAREAVVEFNQLGINIESDDRPIFSIIDCIKFKMYRGIRGFILRLTPFKYRRLLLRINTNII
jgi:hypothetical protein